MKVRKRFLLYYDWENLIQDMSDSDIASLTKWIFRYQNTWEISDMTYWAKLAFSFMRPVFDEDRKDWEEVREVRRKAWSEWWKAKASKLKQNVANASTTKHDIAVIGIDSVSGIDTDTTETDTTIVVWSTDLVPIEKIDNRNKWTQRIIDIVQSEIKNLWYLYEKHAQDRNRATIIAKRQSDWGTFIKDSTEEKEEQIIRQIINYSNSNEFVKKIRNVFDFHEKWKSVANAMKQSVKEAPVLHPNPLCRF